MNKPVLLTVDDDPEVLNAIERDLRQHFRADYRVVKASSGAQALDTVRQLLRRGAQVALFLVDERMPHMTGTQFLLEAIKIYPDARRVLLTAYADTETAIAAINQVGLDHYLLKPWEPPTVRLYPVLEDLLSDWFARARPPFDGIRVAGSALSPASFAVKDFLASNQVPYQWLDTEDDVTVRELLSGVNGGAARLPVVFFPDGSTLVQPTTRELAEKIGLQTRAQKPFYDLIVVGGGPAGLAGALYGASEGLRTILVEQSAPGGQAGTSSNIENYLGFPGGVTGADLARRAATQARRFGAEIITAQEAVEIRREDPYRKVILSDGSELTGYALLIAPGMQVRHLAAEGLEPLLGAGVYYGAGLSEAATYRGRDVVLVGGANSAGQAAMFFSRHCRKVTILVRGPDLAAGMSRYLVDRIQETPNVEVLVNTSVVSACGNGRLDAVAVVDGVSGGRRELPAAAMFIFIGTAPRTELCRDLVMRDSQGFVLTGRDVMTEGHRPSGWTVARDPYLFETNVPGIFCAGDARHGSGKRVAAAVGEGSATVSMVHQYLQTV
ncbi:MAG TPA: FAD-dependent oxidoreductase [Gemmatimonadales bacterium]|jgi:thioredoxin reductase (NADPH)|nr:FAD-dependent oxidoreductase [Gemmatimonadales bacterium]